jgi:hypothetical protein
MVPGGITGTGGIRTIGTISIGVMEMGFIGIMAITGMTLGEINGDMEIMGAI